ncbi:TRAP transporter small permease [Amphritea atlantica]|uniref:TRAP transporter small permease n=1 Tax=Amphritea atlantica TaxID=355243 RepID=UPI003F52A066
MDSADELARLCFVWTIFLAIPHGIRHGAHVGIDLLVHKLPAGIEETLLRVMALVSMFLMVMIMMGSWQATIDRWPELMPTLPITSAVYYIALLVCAVHSILHLAVLAWGGSKIWEKQS